MLSFFNAVALPAWSLPKTSSIIVIVLNSKNFCCFSLNLNNGMCMIKSSVFVSLFAPMVEEYGAFTFPYFWLSKYGILTLLIWNKPIGTRKWKWYFFLEWEKFFFSERVTRCNECLLQIKLSMRAKAGLESDVGITIERWVQFFALSWSGWPW